LRAGEFEATLVDSFVKASRLKAWVLRLDCPPAIKECATLYNKFFPSTDEQRIENQEDAPETHQTKPQHLPQELRDLLTSADVQRCIRLKQHGSLYTTSTVHLGNSLVYYYRNGNKQDSPTPGQIQHIFARERQHYFAVLCHKPAPDGRLDPFRFYNHIPIKIYSSDFAERLEIIQADWVFGHCARWSMGANLVAIVSLSRVRAFPLPLTTFVTHLLSGLNVFDSCSIGTLCK
jgi:hypothetical protein